MNSPLVARVRVDAQGRMVLPRELRGEVVDGAGDVLVRRTADGLLVTAAERAGSVEVAPDGLPVMRIGRQVTNSEVLGAVERERADR